MSLEKIFFAFAVVFTIVFIIQAILAFVGIGEYEMDAPESGGMLDTNHDSDGFPILSFRNFVIFFMIFGWSGLVGVKMNFPKPITILFAFTMGILMMFIVGYIYYLFFKMTNERVDDINYAIDQTGEVYIRIPGNKTGKGKVQLVVQGAVRELDAITDNENELKTGELVKVIEVIDNSYVKVIKI